MTHTIGIIGPGPSIERILAAAAAIDAEGIEFSSFAYDDESEIGPILERNKGAVSGWLFSGPVPYLIAKPQLAADDTADYCRSLGAGFYMACLQVAREHNAILRRFSVDVAEGAMDIEAMLEETGLACDEVYVKQYGGDYDPEEINQFHLQLWQEGKIDAVVTPLRRTFYFLQRQGVPVYHLTLTRKELQQSLEMIVEKVRASYFKNTQVGSLVIEIGRYDEVIARAKTPYELQYAELKLKQVLLPLCKRLDGYLLEKGQGVYEIFSSRGAVEQELTALREVLAEMAETLAVAVPISAGIGFAGTVFAAEINANRALHHARGKEHAKIMIVQEDGVIVEALQGSESLRYAYQSADPELLAKLHQAMVGVRTYRKLEGTVRRMGWASFTVSKLAGQLSVTERNVRRIIMGLHDVGLVEVCGEEAAGMRGRPSKIYRLRNKKPL